MVHTSPTIGSNVEEIVVKNTHFLMWDIGGQESLRSSWNTYYSNTEVWNTSLLLSSRWVSSSRGFLPEHGSWCVCSEHRRQQGPAQSEVTSFTKRSVWKAKLGSAAPLLSSKEENKRGRCARDLKECSIQSYTNGTQSLHMSRIVSKGLTFI